MFRPRVLLLLLFVLLCVVTVVWVGIDRRPPEWDHANHLERAFDCYRTLSEPGHDRVKEITEASSFYPPIVSCAAGVLYFVFPIAPLTAQAVMLAYLAVALISVFALGARLWDPAAGLLAAFFLATAPFVIFSLTNFQLDLPLMAMVALALYLLVGTDHFRHPGWSVAFGVASGLGMLTKPPFAAYVLPPLLWAAWHAVTAPDRRRRLGLMALALLPAAALAIPWYGPRALGLPMQVANRSFKQAAESGHAEAFTPEALSFYLRVLPSQLGVLATLLFVWGLLAVARQRATRAFLWAAVVPFVLFSLIQNKNLRYTLPILPAAALVAVAGVRSLDLRWSRALTWVCAVVGLLQVSMAAFTFPSAPAVSFLPLPLVFGQPPSRADWQHDRILADLARESAGAPDRTVSVVPNFNYFSVSNFRYEAAIRRLPLQMVRPWSDAPLGLDFVLLKTGSQGPSFSVARPERIMKAFDGGDPYLGDVFPVIGEYPLPDGSRGILRRRRIQPLAGIAASRIADLLRAAPAQLIGTYVSDPVGLRARVESAPEALVRGYADRVTLEAESAVVGEIKRRDRTPLRVHEIRVEVDGLLFNPRRLVETGHLEVLDVKTLRVQHLTVIEEDLGAFLRGQPGGVAVRLDDGTAHVRASRLGPTISARVRLLPGRDGSPFALATDHVRIGPLPVPDLVSNWVVRQFDPSPALRRLPIAVVLGSLSIKPGRIEIGP